MDEAGRRFFLNVVITLRVMSPLFERRFSSICGARTKNRSQSERASRGA
jgi:hypothetical protein